MAEPSAGRTAPILRPRLSGQLKTRPPALNDSSQAARRPFLASSSSSYYYMAMTKVQALENEIQTLTRGELAELRTWFEDYDGEIWDRQIEADIVAGKFDDLEAEALAELERGETIEL